MRKSCPQVRVGTSTSDFNLDVNGETFTVEMLLDNALVPDPKMINIYNYSQSLLQLGKKVGGLVEEMCFIVNNDVSVEIVNIGSNPAIPKLTLSDWCN